MIKVSKLALALPVLAVIGSCAQTKTVPLGTEQAGFIYPVREVGVYSHPELSGRLPECALILPVQKSAKFEKLGEEPTEILERHLHSKFERIILVADWRHKADRLGLDFRHSEDQIELARGYGCDAVVRSRLIGSGVSNFLVWSRSDVGIEAVLLDISDKQVLWSARHIADRSHGGLPLSPLGLFVDSYSAQTFASDEEAVLSILEDAVRRISTTL